MAGSPAGDDGILHRVRTGVQWRDLPERFGPWKTVYERHRLWSADGTWERLLQQVQAAADAAGEIDWDVSVDSTIVRAHQHPSSPASRGRVQRCPLPGGGSCFGRLPALVAGATRTVRAAGLTQAGPGAVRLDSLLTEITKLTEVRKLVLPEGLFADCSEKLVAAWRARAIKMSPSELPRRERGRTDDAAGAAVCVPAGGDHRCAGLPDGTYLARMNLAGQKGAHPGGVLVRVVEYRVDGGEVVRLLNDLSDPIAHPAAELAGLYHARGEADSAFRQIKTFQRGPAEVLRSGDPDLVRQEVWAHLVVHHCLTQIIIALADDNGIDPDRVSFVKVLKHTRRSVVRQCTDTPTKIKEFLVALAAKVYRKLDNGVRRLREADRHLKRPDSKYSSKLSYRINTRDRRPTRRVTAKVVTVQPSIVH